MQIALPPASLIRCRNRVRRRLRADRNLGCEDHGWRHLAKVCGGQWGECRIVNGWRACRPDLVIIDHVCGRKHRGVGMGDEGSGGHIIAQRRINQNLAYGPVLRVSRRPGNGGSQIAAGAVAAQDDRQPGPVPSHAGRPPAHPRTAPGAHVRAPACSRPRSRRKAGPRAELGADAVMAVETADNEAAAMQVQHPGLGGFARRRHVPAHRNRVPARARERPHRLAETPAGRPASKARHRSP
jgi:hypothetical protein